MDPAWKTKKFLNLPIKKGELIKYNILGILGEGDLSIIYKAQPHESDEIVAIKVIFKSPKFHPTEGKVLSQLNHLNIIKLIYYCRTNDIEYLVMEYADFGDLFGQIDKNKNLPENIARLVFCQILSGLNYSHSKGICHRDLKSENILLFNDGRVVIADWGFSEKMSRKPKRHYPRGSIFHAAPEIWNDKKYIGSEPDIWSLGIILYTMLVGHCPFQGETNEETVSQIITGEYQVPKDWSYQLKDLMAGLLTIESQRRVTILQIKNHPWINQAISKSSKSSESSESTEDEHSSTEFHLKLPKNSSDQSDISPQKSVSSRLSPRSIWKSFFRLAKPGI